jgi:hypothetical protein
MSTKPPPAHTSTHHARTLAPPAHQPTRYSLLSAHQLVVLVLMLQKGHDYDDLAYLLVSDRAAIGELARAACDVLAPAATIAVERRAVITDYLLGEMSDRRTEEMRDHLAESEAERDWARAVARALTPLAAKRNHTARPMPADIARLTGGP